jgi:hypothetical protein
MPRLNQILAIEADVKSKTTSELTKLHRMSDAPGLFNGVEKNYRPKDEEGERFPPEKVKVQARAMDVVNAAGALYADLINVVSQKDVGNMKAVANVVVDGNEILSGVPATHLLWLDKRLEDWHTFINKMPELDIAEQWNPIPEDKGMYRTEQRQTIKTAKIQTPMVLIPPGPHTQGKAEIITVDNTVGYWDTVKFSAAIPANTKKELLARIQKLLRAVRFAREEANKVDVPEVNFGTVVMDYLLK